MEQSLRNALQRTTQQVRVLLEREYTDQLAGTYDIRRGEPIPERPGAHLRDPAQLLVRRRLVEAVQHKIAAGRSRDQAIDDYTREAAFTTLNRFVALKMLEARGLVQECVSRGEQSGGYKEFTGLAPELALLPDGSGYRLYLECLFDEIGTGVKVLFDRRDPASLLWPRRQALLDLLEALNAGELKEAWGQDETIGWVYQYFNSEQERRRMRDESQAPRDSYELAVRNQFFTPRYVVEFLSDNTLGRTWYEMRRGQTRLVQQCRHLVRRPTEVFLDEGQEPPAQEAKEDLSQEELLRQPVYIPHRAKKDPRDLKVLDPACGSGHFLLYCFELLWPIYEEAWADEQSPRSEGSGQPLREDYPRLDTLRQELPGLILRHNLWGVDIDARCAQIAAFALWLRAQRAFNDLGLSRSARPLIRRTNIVVAEPMPGEEDVLEEFLRGLHEDRLEGLLRRVADVPQGHRLRASEAMADSLCDLVRTIWEKMKLAGEAGTLLKIEEELADAVKRMREEWEGSLPFFRVTEYTLEGTGKEHYYRFVPGEHDGFWQKAELLTLAALRDFAVHAGNGNIYQRKLFVDDAERGFAFIDLCRQTYDAIVMNPPFGECPARLDKALREKWQSLANDIYVLFFLVATDRLAEFGRLGAITSRGYLAGRDQREFRPRILGKGKALLMYFVDLGLNVLDGAAVETGLSILQRTQYRHPYPIWFLDIRSGSRGSLQDLRSLIAASSPIVHWNKRFWDVTHMAILYTATDEEILALRSASTLDPHLGRVTKGLQTSDNERFLRVYWEVPIEALGTRWCFIAKGGESQWFISSIKTVVDWLREGDLVAAHMAMISDNIAQARRSSAYYGRPGLTYTYRCSNFALRCLPKGSLFTNSAPVLIAHDSGYLVPLLAAFLSEKYEGLLRQVEKKGQYAVGRIGKLPTPMLQPNESQEASWRRLFDYLWSYESRDEVSPYFVGLDAQFVEHDAPFDAQYFSSLTREFALTSHLPPSDHVISLATNFFQEKYCASHAHTVISYCVGRAFGRFGTPPSDYPPDPFAPLDQQLPAVRAGIAAVGSSDSAPSQRTYTILVHEAEARSNSPLVVVVTDHLSQILGSSEAAYGWIDRLLPDGGVSDYLAQPSRFFDSHLSQYSAAFRRAPIYWQLSTQSGTFSVWLYYHRLTRDTFYKVLNDYVNPKVTHEQRKLDRLRTEAGENPTRAQRDEIEPQEKFVEELRAFREEVERVAPLWNPNLNDGVLINFAPLWRLVPQHREWQRECKACWDKLLAGDYDWSHLAMHLWPERVVPKCQTDASLAIAHGLEDTFWTRQFPNGPESTEDQAESLLLPVHESEGGDDQKVLAPPAACRGRSFPRWVPREGVTPQQIAELITERTGPAVKAALEKLLSAPPPLTARARTSGGRARSTSPRPRDTAPPACPDGELLTQVRQALTTATDGLAKSAIVAATGATAGAVDAALRHLMASGTVVKTGRGPGTRYRLNPGS